MEESREMDRRRRDTEQQGHRHLAKVHARNHEDQQNQFGPDENMENGPLQHPYLNTQRFDGIDPHLNPNPPTDPEARREYENALRLQHQLKLQNRPELSPTRSFNPTPRVP